MRKSVHIKKDGIKEMCFICLHEPCLTQCPNFEKKTKVKYRCSLCGNEIMSNDEYIVNEDNEYRHYDCILCDRELFQWLGIKIETMD